MAGIAIVLDTHTLLWWTQEPALLSADAAQAIDHADWILIPAICFWETALLVRKGHLALKPGQPSAEWAEQVLAIPRVHAVPLSADRFIVATALAEAFPLVTKDDLLRALGWLDTTW